MRFTPLDPEAVAAARRGAPNANGQPPEQAVSTGPGHPCRSCLRNIAGGEPMLVLAARPFAELHPYAELGPIFLHTRACAPWSGEGLPPVLTSSGMYLVRGYGADERIVYGTGGPVPADRVVPRIAELLGEARIAFVHIRSASNNCWLARAER